MRPIMDYDAALDRCYEAELDPSMDRDQAAAFYLQHAVICLIRNEVLQFKLLWARAPKDVRSVKELMQVHTLAACLHKREFANFWSEQSSMSWDDDLRPMINDMTLAVRERLIRFLSEAFSRLDISYASQFLGSDSADETIALFAGCSVQNDEETDLPKYIIPSRQEPAGRRRQVGIEHLNGFVKYVLQLDKAAA